MSVRVRFAPSPTGFLHVGGARTAIFNWLFARHHRGTFVLRVEDTDADRNSQEATEAILEGMAWLGMEPDEGPFFQSRLKARHAADAARLLASGHAYRCFCTPETIRAERETVEKAGGTYLYPRRCRSIPHEEADRRAAMGEPFAVRLEVPHETIAWDDAVHGPTSFDGALIEDLVVLRSDGTPTYNLSVVSDDLAMGITHVIRGDDHLSNTPKQIAIYRALDREPPVFAHLPMIYGEDKRKLSKRHGAVSVLAYREAGYLPDALFNFLALLGWSSGDDRQKLSRRELIEVFDLPGVGKSGAVFDRAKLDWLNGQYLTELPLERLAAEARPRLESAGLWRDELAGTRSDWLLRLLALARPRCRTLAEIPDHLRRFLDPSDEFPYEAEAAKKHLGVEGLAGHLRALSERFAALGSWETAPLEAALRGTARQRGLSAGKLIHPVRLAVTGRGSSPGLFEVLELLGRERTLARIGRLFAHLERTS
jgi:glutamyl-tRNA synthetase